MGLLDQLNVSTRRLIQDKPALVDNVFQKDPLAAYQKLNLMDDYDGGTLIQEGFLYDGMIGGPYDPGDEFDITEKQVEQAGQFNIRYVEVNVTLSKEDIQVVNKGPNAVFRLLDSRMAAAYMTLGAQMAIAQYLNGVNANYTANINGLAEALNDGTNASWDGNVYADYGGVPRNGVIGKALNPGALINVGGALSFSVLENSYGDCSVADEEPNLGVTTVLGYSYIKEHFQDLQRFNDNQNPEIGFNGMKFNRATLIKSRYAPGTYISGTNDPIATQFIKKMSKGVLTAYPTVTAETLWWITAKKPYIRLYITDDAEFGGGFTGFKPAQGNTKVAGQVLLAYEMTVPSPRMHGQVFGFTS